MMKIFRYSVLIIILLSSFDSRGAACDSKSWTECSEEIKNSRLLTRATNPDDYIKLLDQAHKSISQTGEDPSKLLLTTVRIFSEREEQPSLETVTHFLEIFCDRDLFWDHHESIEALLPSLTYEAIHAYWLYASQAEGQNKKKRTDRLPWLTRAEQVIHRAEATLSLFQYRPWFESILATNPMKSIKTFDAPFEGKAPTAHEPLPPLSQMNWSHVREPARLEEMSPLLRPAYENHLQFLRIAERFGKDIEGMKAHLLSNPGLFSLKDYQQIGPSLRGPLANLQGISVLCATHRPWDLPRILENYRYQTHPDKELVLVLNGTKYDLRATQTLIAQESEEARETIRLIDLIDRTDLRLGDYLNIATAYATKDIVTKWDGDDIYGPNYLAHIGLPLYYGNTDITAVDCAVAYFEISDQIQFLFSGSSSFRFCPHTPNDGGGVGSSITFPREISRMLRFPSKTLGEDGTFFDNAYHLGLTTGSSGSFNHVVMRSRDETVHTWQGVNERGTGFKFDPIAALHQEGKVLYKGPTINGIFINETFNLPFLQSPSS